jgi:hypothetical protein
MAHKNPHSPITPAIAFFFLDQHPVLVSASEVGGWRMDCTAAIRFSKGLLWESFMFKGIEDAKCFRWYVACKAGEWIQRAQKLLKLFGCLRVPMKTLGSEREKQRDKRDCIMRNFMVGTLHQITYVTVIRSRRARCATHEVRLWEMRNGLKFLVEKSERKILHGRYLHVRIILKWILN